MPRDASYYSDRIYGLAVMNPDVNIMDDEQVCDFAREKCDELFLKPDPIVEKIRARMVTTNDLQTARKHGVRTKDLI